MKHLLFVESNESVTGIQTAKELGYFVTLLTQNIQHYLKGQPLESHMLRLVDRVIEVDTSQEQAVVDFVKAYHQENPLTGVFSFSEFYVIQATAAAHAIGLPTMHPDATKNARRKDRSRELCVANGVPVPESIACETLEEAQKAAQRVGYPCVIKPCDGAMGVGVVLVHNAEELSAAYQEYLDNRYYGRNLYGMTTVLIEEYMVGPLISVETVTFDGQCHVIGITDRDLTGFPYFVELGAAFPVQLPYEAEVIDVVKRGLDAMGVDFGPCHTEVVLTPNGPKIIEINPRLAGSCVPDLIRYSLGVDLPKEVMRMHMGEVPNLTPTWKKAAACMWLCSPVEGVLEAVEGAEQVRELEDVAYLQVDAPNRQVTYPRSNFDWLGKMIVVGEDLPQTRQRLQEVQELLTIKVRTGLLSPWRA